MIVNAILETVFGILDFIFGLLAIPAAPLIVTDAVSAIFEFLAYPIGLTRLLLTDSFMVAAFTAVIAYIIIEPIYLIGMKIFNMVRGAGA